MKKYGYIYCTTDLKNGIKYIGQKKSDIFIPTYFGSGRIIKCKLKSRPETFRVDLIEWCYSQDELNICEKDWTDAVGLYPLSYNLKSGGEMPGISDYTRIKMSENKKGKPSNRKGKKISIELSNKLSVLRKGKPGNNKGKHWKIKDTSKMSEALRLRWQKKKAA